MILFRFNNYLMERKSKKQDIVRCIPIVPIASIERK